MEEDDGDEIVDGIEGCIGNTPLIRIKSLSVLTGCDILAKAEVRKRWGKNVCGGKGRAGPIVL
jgi:threonine dehydratase